MTEIKDRIKNVLEQNGVYIDNWEEELDFDSITFISTIVGLEQEFGIEVPDDMLLYENFRNFKLYVENIQALVLKEE